MSSQTHLPDHPKSKSIELLTFTELKVTAALVLIALGIVFFLGQSKVLDYSSSWWVIFIAIPGLVLLYAAYDTHQKVGTMTGLVYTQAVLGLIAVVLSLLFIVDPTWSFTRNWSLDQTFPFLRDIVWDNVWPWLLVVPGVALLYLAVRDRSMGTGLFAAGLILIGGVFILNISWNVVWPLALVLVGVWLLFVVRPRES